MGKKTTPREIYFLSIFPATLIIAGCGMLGGNVDTETATAKELFPDKQECALVIAAETGDVATIDELVAQGVDINARGRGEVTPLLRALTKRNKAGFESLLEHGADPNLLDHQGFSAVHRAAQAPSDYWLKTLFQYKADPNLTNTGIPFPAFEDQTPIYYTISKHHPANARALIKAGADIDHQAKFGKTPLHYAASHADFDIVYDLLQAGADYRKKDDNGHDIIFLNIKGRTLRVMPKEKKEWFLKVVKFLKSKGVDLSEYDED